MPTFKNIDGKLNKYIDYAGLYLIGLLSLGFLLLYRSFAKLHITLPVANVPFFIGDMVFAACFLLFCLKYLINPGKITNNRRIFLAYFIFVTIKTILGCYFWDPLALRHAVMFYYPLLAVFAYSFYTPVFFPSWKRLAIIAVFLFIFKFLFFHPYYSLTSVLLIVILISRSKSLPVKLVLFTLLVFLFPHDVFFNTSRSFIMGNILSFTYILSGILIIYKVKKLYRFILFAFFGLFIVGGLLTISSRNDLKSLIGFNALAYRYNLWENTIRANEGSFIKPDLKLRLYNDKRDTFEQIKIAEHRIEMAKKQKQGLADSGVPEPIKQASGEGVNADSKLEKNVEPKGGPAARRNLRVAKPLVKEKDKAKGKELFSSKINRPKLGDIGAEENRHINVSYANILFRVFIWRDALVELADKKPLFGFAFGYPFRSHSLEVLGWATTEWMADGWICLHNSYLDLVYRAGIVGLLMVILIIIMLVKFTVISLRKRSLTGIMLTGILINWLIAANFLEILEMPYSAIPLWSLFGLTFAYLFKPKPE